MSFDPGAADTAHIEALERHFGDLRDGTHGHHGDTVSRAGKERHFARAVELLEPYALKVLGEFDTALFHEEGRVESSGLQRTADGGLVVNWTLSWAEQRASGIDPITLIGGPAKAVRHRLFVVVRPQVRNFGRSGPPADACSGRSPSGYP